MTTYIKPPRSEDCEWRSGPPPEIGWWPASTKRNPKLLRYYNGIYWSRGVTPDSVPDTAGFHGSLIAPEYQSDIEWTDRWWLK